MQEDEAEVGLKSAMYSFSDQGELSLLDNVDLTDFVNGIKKMTVSDAVANVTGLAEGEVVESILVEVSIDGGDSFELLSATNINSESDQTLTNVQAVMDAWGTDYNKVLTVTVSGTRNFTTIGHAPVKTNLVLPTKVSYSPLDL
ncbi:MAG: hypothetical protein PF541_03850 [Prolixibacteraceae bacterium]|jgi:hypothetical protein|nr:hypothetical protein [Prolixibacteraceae bacterium]